MLSCHHTILQIFSVLIGDMDDAGEYKDYFNEGCRPEIKDEFVFVQKVEEKLKICFEDQGLGVPFEDNKPIKSILESIFELQAMKVIGPKEEAFKKVIEEVQKVLREEEGEEAEEKQSEMVGKLQPRKCK